jgi:hypothetical protein
MTRFEWRSRQSKNMLGPEPAMGQKRIKTNMQTGEAKIALAIHGRAGTIARSQQTAF